MNDGKAYEYYIKEELLKKYDKVYLWAEVPKKVLREANIISCYEEKRHFQIECGKNPIDTGVDIVYYDDCNKKWFLVQCKNYGEFK